MFIYQRVIFNVIFSALNVPSYGQISGDMFSIGSVRVWLPEGNSTSASRCYDKKRHIKLTSRTLGVIPVKEKITLILPMRQKHSVVNADQFGFLLVLSQDFLGMSNNHRIPPFPSIPC